MNEKTNLSIPANFALCLHSNCPMAETCLHQIAFSRHAELGPHLRLLNPALCSPSSQCSHYLINKPTTFARGFKNFQKQMFPEQYTRFTSSLILHYGRNPFYKRRRGEIALAPQEQELILTVLRRSGIKKTFKFDSYFEDILWK